MKHCPGRLIAAFVSRKTYQLCSIQITNPFKSEVQKKRKDAG